jgi:hypothetical protein
MTWQDVRMTSRRELLRGAFGLAGAAVIGAGALAGCDSFDGNTQPDRPSPLLGFLTATGALADRYDATIAAVPALSSRLIPVRDAHRAHVKALAAALPAPTPGPATPASQVPTDSTAALAALVTAEKAGRDDAVTACLAAEPRLAPLVGSIAAARATHLEVLT